MQARYACEKILSAPALGPWPDNVRPNCLYPLLCDGDDKSDEPTELARQPFGFFDRPK